MSTRLETLEHRYNMYNERMLTAQRNRDHIVELIAKQKKRDKMMKSRVAIPRYVLKEYNNIHDEKPVTEFQMQAMLSDDVLKAIKDKEDAVVETESVTVIIKEGRIIKII